MSKENAEVYGIIYKITNKINNKIYIGQTTVGFENRYHNNLEKYTHNKHLKYSIGKYGIDNFIIETELDVAYSKEELNELERQYILETDSLLKGYNETLGGEGVKGLPKELHGMYGTHRCGKENPFYGKKHTNVTKLKISKFASTRIGSLNPNFGGGDKTSGKDNPMYGISPKERMDADTYEHWRKGISNSVSGKNNPNAKQIINITTGEIFDYIKDAIKIYGEIAISVCCRRKCKTAGKCKWMYYSDYIKLQEAI